MRKSWIEKCNTKVTGPIITWPTYATFHLCINSTFQTKKFYVFYRAIAKQAVSFNCQLAKKNYLQINAFLANVGRLEKNFEALLVKATESLSGGVREEILSSINKHLGGSHSVVARDCFAWTQPAWILVRQPQLVCWSSIAAVQFPSSRVILIV